MDYCVWLLLSCPSLLWLRDVLGQGYMYNCLSRYPEGLIKDGKIINFRPFPSEKKFKERRELWIRYCSRADEFKCTKDSYICSLHFVGENRPTDKDPNPVPATASGEKVCYLCVYCMSTYYSDILVKILKNIGSVDEIGNIVSAADLSAAVLNLFPWERL